MIINFDKISWQQILILCKVIHSSSSLNIKTIARWYNLESINFQDTLKFLEEVKVIKTKNEKLLPSLALKRVIKLDRESIKQFFIDILFQKKNNLLKYFGEFFNGFEQNQDSYGIVPTTQERLKYSGVRNFLIGLGVLHFEPITNRYFIKKEFATTYLSYKNITYDQFEKRINSEKELGLIAELLIYKLEKNKFKKNTYVQKKIRHVSLENVMAGYDIKSYEIRRDGKIIPKYIEVKAVSSDDWKFYWSKNEISKAKCLGESYYLYLIPVKNRKTLEITALRQIKNPYRKVFLNQKHWRQEIEILSFSIKIEKHSK